MKFKKKSFFPLLFVAHLFLVIAWSNDTEAQKQTSARVDSLSARMEKFFGGRSADDPGAVLIIKKGKDDIYRRIFGKANLETGTDITNETVFEAASVSKQFVAACVLLLAEEGRLSLDDDVRKHVPELPDYGYVITLRHLLTHTGGLKDWRNITYLTPLSTATRLFNQNMALEVIFSQSSLNFKPGSQYRYSNSGYDLLGTIVERVSGQQFRDFANEKLLQPAGMTNSAFRDKYTDIIKNRALGYLTQNNKFRQGLVLDETTGAAGLYTTAEDLQKWNAFVFSGKVSDTFKKLRLTQFVLDDGTIIPYANGGVEVHTYNGHQEIRHGGLISGYRAWLAYYPDADISVSYMSNDRSISTVELSQAIKEALFGKVANTARQREVQPTEHEINSLKGIYLNIDNHSDYFELTVKDGKVFNNGNEVHFIREKEFILDNDRYERVGNGLRKTTPEGISVYNKTEGLTKQEADGVDISGRYQSDDCGATFDFVARGEKFFAQRSRYDEIELTPLFKVDNTLAFRGMTNGLRAIFFFTGSATGQHTLKVSLPRADAIPFNKEK